MHFFHSLTEQRNLKTLLTIISLLLQEQTQPNRRLLSTVRGRLRQAVSSLQTVIRFRRFSRKDSQPPDWFVDKSHQDDTPEKEEDPVSNCWGQRVVVDPASLSYYIVSYANILKTLIQENNRKK